MSALSYDLVIVAKSSSDTLKAMTRRCINSARQDGANLNIIIVETSGIKHHYRDIDRIVMYKGPFNYNHALNEGLKHAVGDIYIMANNDLLFHKGWSEIGPLMIVNEYPSASAFSEGHILKGFKRGDYVYPGYAIAYHVAGWCIFCTKECYQQIGGLDESLEFWYSDNLYADQLIKAGIKHGLFCNVQVDHVTSATLRTIPPKDQRRYSYDLTGKYNSLKRRMDASREAIK